MKGFNRKDSIKLAGIVRESITDGPGICFTVFCQGCPHNCQGCHNPVTWSFEEGGKYVDVNRILAEIDKNPILQGVTFSGGEPLCQSKGFLSLAKGIKKRKLKINLFTGYTFEEIQELRKIDEDISQLLDLVNILIEGRFNIKEKNLSLKFRGSENQRIIDMNKTREAGTLVLADEYM